MKKYTSLSKLFHFTLFISFVLVLVSSCKKDESGNPQYDYLVDYEKVNSFSQETIVSTFNLASLQYPEIIYLAEQTRYPVDVYIIRYKTWFHNEEIVASGLICIPDAEGNFPFISFQNGTNALNANAPSVNHSYSMYLIIELLAGNGYIMVIPDYTGFGSTENIVHPYYQKESTTGAVIDMLFAAREMIENYSGDAFYNLNQYLMGYSQGGWSTLVTLYELENNLDIPFEIKATSCGSGAYNLMDVSGYILSLDSFPGPLYLPYYIYSHQQFGTITDPLDVFFNEPYASIIPDLFDGTYSNSQINAQLTNSVPELLQADFISGFANNDEFTELISDLKHNSIEAWDVSSPVHFYHGNADMNVPVFESQNIYSDFVDLGLSSLVEYTEMDGLNHETGTVPWGVQTVQWFNSIEYP
ncbi:MAG: hypothetical protein JW894_13895 [Bacteroidales bacterium]|nr:hypothetical protein [Bacteroidales bacterium]